MLNPERFKPEAMIKVRKNLQDDPDRNNFLERLGGILKETKAPYLVWAFMPNHIHLDVSRGGTGIPIICFAPDHWRKEVGRRK